MKYLKKYLATVIPCENLSVGANRSMDNVSTGLECSDVGYYTGDTTCDLDNCPYVVAMSSHNTTLNIVEMEKQ